MKSKHRLVEYVITGTEWSPMPPIMTKEIICSDPGHVTVGLLEMKPALCILHHCYIGFII